MWVLLVLMSPLTILKSQLLKFYYIIFMTTLMVTSCLRILAILYKQQGAGQNSISSPTSKAHSDNIQNRHLLLRSTTEFPTFLSSKIQPSDEASRSDISAQTSSKAQTTETKNEENLTTWTINSIIEKIQKAMKLKSQKKPTSKT